MTKVNTVKSLIRKKSGKLALRFFDNSGQIREKTLDLTDTKANRKRIWKEIVPLFESELKKRAETPLIAVDFGVYAEKYLVHLKAVKHSKLVAHTYRIEKLVSHFGQETDIGSITELEVEEFFHSLDIQRSTKLDWLVVLRGIFERARKGRAIRQSVVKDFRLPMNDEALENDEHIMPFEAAEVQKLLEISEGTMLHNYLGIAFHLGLRPEETIALMIRDIDLDAQVVHVERAITKGRLKTTKTASSKRSLPIAHNAVPFFEAQIAYAKSKNSIFLFCFSNGTRLNDIEDLRGVKKRNGPWYQLLERAKLPYRKISQTRHTFAVHAIKSGKFTLQEIAAMLGHTSLDMLFGHYGKYLGKSHLKVERSVDIYETTG